MMETNQHGHKHEHDEARHVSSELFAREPVEFAELRELVRLGRPYLKSRVACEVSAGGHRLAVPVLTLGTDSADAPVAAFFGGVHGLERIGIHVVLAYLRELVQRLAWDDRLHRQLESVRLVFMPIVNPGGLLLRTRANPNGVDLMRSSPMDAQGNATPLVGGHRIGPWLPWYRGRLRSAGEVESSTLHEVVEQELLGHPFSIALDCHSGFGLVDRLWFPWACRRTPIDHVGEMHALSELLDQEISRHQYVVEPQSHQYMTHGDLWDHLYRQFCERSTGIFLPLTLEMGSWQWVRKNPLQLFSRLGLFNPVQPHCRAHVLERHRGGLNFIAQAAANWHHWVQEDSGRRQHRDRALTRWYGAHRLRTGA